jgi:enamine deaminase RidA (YjgF/YER057c/UK114 family)
MNNLKSINPKNFKWFDYERYSFSLGLALDGSLYISGHSASEYDAANKKIVVKGGMEEQVNTALDKIDCILKAEGASLSDATHVIENVTIKGLDFYREYEKVKADRLPANISQQLLVVDSLLRPDALIELEIRVERSIEHSKDSIITLPTLTASTSVDKNDVVAQTQDIYEQADSILQKTGFELSDIVKTTDHITPPGLMDYKYTGRVRKEKLGPVYPGATGILMTKVSKDNSLISINITAAKGEKKAINPGWERYQKLTYSPAVKCGNNLFMSGQASLDPETEKAVYKDSIYEQSKYTYSNIIKVLEAADMSPKNLIKTIEYVTPTGLKDYRSTSSVRLELLSEPYPASTGIVCHSLLRPEFLIEIDPFAKVFDV